MFRKPDNFILLLRTKQRETVMRRFQTFALLLLAVVGVNSQLAAANSLTAANAVEQHATIISSDNSMISLEFELSDLSNSEVDVDGNPFDAVSVMGEGTTYDYGQPLLPSVSRFVVVPPAAGLEFVYRAGEPTRERAENRPLICQEGEVTIGLTSIIDQNGGLYPPAIAEMSEPFIIRGVRMVKVTTYPVQYDRNSNSYLHYDHIETEIVYNDDDPINPVDRQERRNRSKEFLKFIDALAINGDEVRRDDPDRDRDPEFLGHYLVAIHENCLEYVAPFIEWRRKAGYKVDILSLTNNQGGNQNTVQGLIQDRYDAYLDAGLDPFEYLLIVGDRSSYNQGGNQENGNWIVESHNGNTIWSFRARHADYLYGCLEGNDHYPDVALCRMPSGDANRLNIAVGRTLAYEAEPHMGDTDWFTRGGVFSQHWGNGANTAWHITIHTNVRWGKEVLEFLNFDEVRFYEEYDWDQVGARVGPFERDLYNDGSNLHLGRAENYYWRYNFNNVDENVVFPIRLVISGHGEWAAENSFRTNRGNQDLMGQVAGTCGWGGPPTAPMSAIWMELLNSHLLLDMPLGWARTFAVTDFERFFPDFNFSNQPLYRMVKSDVDAYGDPGIKYWKGVPQEVIADHDEVIPPDSRMVNVYVFDREEEFDVQGAQVTLYAPGNMPNFDNDNYADYDGYQMWTTTSDQNGIARFVFDEGELDPGNIFVTVTGREIRPYFSEIEVENVDAAVDVVSYTLDQVNGNDDDIINPSESFNLTITAGNIGNRNNVEDITAVVTSGSPYVTVEENELSFGNIAAGDEAETDDVVTFHISEFCPDGDSRPITRPVLLIAFSAGQQRWRSAIELNPSAPNYEVSSVIGGTTVPVDRHDLDIRIENVGSSAGPPVTAELVSLGNGVINLANSSSRYPAIAAGRTATLTGNDFITSGNRMAVPGTRSDMLLILTSEAGFIDTAYFELHLEDPRENAPQGPDGYGYYCFDNSDEDWDISPEFSWIEISREERDREYNGTLCDFEGRGDHANNIGESQVVDLGFTTQFYGHDYSQITICTNGFISMGDQEGVTNFQNWPLDRSMGGGLGMVAALWDKLRFVNGSGVYYYHNEDDGTFIIEWYKLRHADNGNDDLTFQIILQDKEVWPSETGDQMILVQYLEVSNFRGDNNRVQDNPFASVGICSPDGTTGINYTWNDEYPVTSEELGDRQAILYTTALSLFSGFIYGHVTDVATEQPLENVIINTEHGYTATTDGEGYWQIPEALAELEFDITAILAGYNDSTLVDLFLEENDSLEINFALLHPEFSPSFDEYDAFLLRGHQLEEDFSIRNDGNGPLAWSVDKRLADEFDVPPWEERVNHRVGEEVDDSRIKGVVFANNKFYVSGGGTSDREDNFVYRLDREGNLEDQFQQLGGSRYGMNDLAWDGEILWGGEDEMIYGISLDGEEVTSFESPFSPTNNLAWDSDREILWLSGKTTNNVYGYDRDGNPVDTLNRPGNGITTYGLSYYPEDREFPLYFNTKRSQDSRPWIYKMNIETGDTQLVNILEPEALQNPEGTFITNSFDAYSWVYMGINNVSSDDGGDRLIIWQIDARKDWFALEPNEGGILAPNEVQEFVLTLNAEGLPAVVFDGFFDFTHNATGGHTIIPISLEVQVGAGEPARRTLHLRDGWNLVSLNIEPNDIDIPILMEPLVEEGQLLMMKNGTGQFYLPADDFNNIPGWDFSQGYKMYMSEAVDFLVQGIVVLADEPIELNAGWNMNAYLPQEPLPPAAALSNIVDELIIAKDGEGHFYLPEFDFDNIIEMIPGNGYQFRVSQDVELIYNIDDRVAMAPRRVATPPAHFTHSDNSGSNMSLLAIGDKSHDGWELGAYDANDNLIGAGRFDGARCGLALWGDDPSTAVSEGIANGSAIYFRIWDGEIETSAVIQPIKGEATYRADDILIGNITTVGEAPVVFGLQKSYPNPTNGPMRITYGVEEAGRVSLTLFDLAGREAATLVDEASIAGYHEVVWNTDSFPSGLYLIRLETVGRNSTRKVAVVK